MAKEGDRRSHALIFPLPNQFVRHFQHDRRNIPPRKGILLMQEGVPIEALVLIESSHKCAESSICRKEVWRNPDIRTKIQISRYRSGFTLNQTLSGVTTKSVVTRRLPHHKRLNVSMLHRHPPCRGSPNLQT